MAAGKQSPIFSPKKYRIFTKIESQFATLQEFFEGLESLNKITQSLCKKNIDSCGKRCQENINSKRLFTKY